MDFDTPALVYNEEDYGRTPTNQKSIFIYEWLRNLEDNIFCASKAQIKNSQQKLEEQLSKQLTEILGPPTRQLLAKCFAGLYSVGSAMTLYQTVNKCSDIIKSKDESQSYLPIKLTAVTCIGAIYEKLGRMAGGSFQETVQTLIKAMRNAESQGRCEIMLCLEQVLRGLGSNGAMLHRDIYKAVRGALTDRSMSVRCASAKCALELIKQANFLYTSELEGMTSTCFKALEGSNYDVRVCVAQLIGTLMATSQQISSVSTSGKNKKTCSLEEVFAYMTGGFLRGGIGFLKGSGGELLKTIAPREVRVGVTQAYVIFFTEMGGVWIQRNIGLILKHVLELLSSPKATQTHVDAVYSRRCISFILRAVLGRLLGEPAQLEAAKELCSLITKQMNMVNEAVHNAADGSNSSSAILSMDDVISTQHVLVCALQELGCLVQGLSTTALSLMQENLLDHVFSVLLHPAPAAQLLAAWCLRCMSVAAPSQATPLIDRCVDRISSLKSSGEAVGGYAHTLAALVGGVYQCPLGIPHAKGKAVFHVADELLKSAAQNPRLALHKAKAGWTLLGSLMTLGPSVVKHHLPQLLALWSSAFPKTVKEFEQEKARGDAYTWHVTLEFHAGTLCSMASFCTSCPVLLSDDMMRRLLVITDACLAMLPSFPQVTKQHGNHLKASAAIVRLRLYSVLRRLPPKLYEGSFHSLLRGLVAEFTLAENPAMTTTSLLRTVCHKDDSILLGSWMQETDHKFVEEQLQTNSASGSGSLEHDPSCIFEPCPEGEDVPGPLPLGVAVIDESIKLFGTVFPFVALKHRNQLLAHFAECIRQAKSSRQQAIQTNILTAFLFSLKGLADSKSGVGDEEVRNTAVNLVMGAVTNPDPIVRCAAGEALGRIAQAVGSPVFTSSMTQRIFDQLKAARDAVSRTGYSVALGCIHRYVGGMASGHHLNSSVSILLALSKDNSSSLVQVWALHALALIADCGGPMFRSYVSPTLEQVVNLVLTVPTAITEVHQCLGKCLAALITSIGPELQETSKSIHDLRLSCVVACAVMQNHPDSLVQAEAINCLQQLHVFAPSHINLGTVVRKLSVNLSSPHLLLRRATIACFRQLSQREAKNVCEHALAAAEELNKHQQSSYAVVIGDKGLEGALFGMLDTETDTHLRSDIHDTLNSMLQTLAADNLTHWLGLCRDVLSASKSSTGGKGGDTQSRDALEGDEEGEGDEGDEGGGMTAGQTPEETHPKVDPRWPTRVFATGCIKKIVAVCQSKQAAHFDLALARERRQESGEDFLVMHLQELVRMVFIAATAICDQLKLEGLSTLQDVVSIFASVPDPDYPGHVILEQFQAQVGAALRPAFASDVPSDVTAMACEVCSAWIASGIARDLNDVRRIQQLLVTKLSKVGQAKDSSLQLYNEAATTMEKLAVLKAWAEVYIVAMKQRDNPSSGSGAEGEDQFPESSGSLLELVEPELKSLSKYWLGALRDHALLALPTEYSSQLPPQGGMFYSPDSMDQARPHYQSCWPSIVHAASLWLNNGGFESTKRAMQEGLSSESLDTNSSRTMISTATTPAEVNTDHFHLLVGICMESLCSSRATQPNSTVSACLNAFYSLLDSQWSRTLIGNEQILGVEMLCVLHRVLLTRDSSDIQLTAMKVVRQIVKSAEESTSSNPEAENHGEDDLTPGRSLVFGVMEICMCVLKKQLPNLLPQSGAFSQPPVLLVTINSGFKSLTEESSRLISEAVSILPAAPVLCTPEASVNVLPSVLYLLTSCLREVALIQDSSAQTSVSATLQALKQLTSSPYTQNPKCSKDWIDLLQSALATVLSDAKSSAECTVPDASASTMDDSVVMLALAIFIVSAPKEILLASDLQNKCIGVFTRCVRSSSIQLQLKALQTLESVFQCREHSVSFPFINALAPHIVMLLNDMCINKPITDEQLTITLAAIKIMEVLVELTEDHLKVHMLGLLVPILISLLSDSANLPKGNKVIKTLHEQTLQKLMRIGPKYPEPFRTVMTSMPDLKRRLEAAVRANQPVAKPKQPTVQAKVAPAKPSITLRMDFSNYK
ncbi:PREDICTED: HEAT repeat-containing protein 5B-like isoform X1 [Acropora digitifera]|uniref:HEAT repeat-containing protein 5B-like isoform X1 n=1 Tax=Acropora digitifera TaxID=70779 RepID=UPI00077AD5FB|nr:PREDICTED: HEAT repeat-containing protein 5B-like isoform X1 [Acropora digitifera]